MLRWVLAEGEFTWGWVGGRRVLEAWWRQRALSREPAVWAKVLLMLTPPRLEFGMYLWNWQP